MARIFPKDPVHYKSIWSNRKSDKIICFFDHLLIYFVLLSGYISERIYLGKKHPSKHLTTLWYKQTLTAQWGAPQPEGTRSNPRFLVFELQTFNLPPYRWLIRFLSFFRCKKILMPHHNGLGLFMTGGIIPCNEATTDDFVDTQK